MTVPSLIEHAERTPPKYDNLEKYYEAENRLDAIGVTLPEDVRVLEMVSSIPKLTVDVLVEVLNVQGFTLKGNPKLVEILRRWWQANDLDTEMQLGFTEALVQGRAYILVGYGTKDTPLITLHDSRHVAIRRDFLGRVCEAVIVFASPTDDPVEDAPLQAAHYLPGTVQTYSHDGGSWRVQGEPRSTGVAGIPVVPMINRARLKDISTGRSEITEVLGLSDGESRSLTNLQVAQELLALPQRYLFGDGITKFKDQSGNPITKFKAYMSALWTGPENAKAGQFPGADLSQIINVIKLYAQKVSAITGIPPSMLGISTDNPSSAEAMRAAKERLITRGEFKQRLFGDPIEEAMRIGLEMYDLLPADGAETLETNWRDVASPSRAAKAANILQAHAQGVVSSRLAREYLDLTPEQRASEDSLEADANALARAVGLPSRAPAGADEDNHDQATRDEGNSREEKP